MIRSKLTSYDILHYCITEKKVKPMKWWKKLLFSATFRTIVGIILSDKQLQFENLKITVISSSEFGFTVRFEYVDIKEKFKP